MKLKIIIKLVLGTYVSKILNTLILKSKKKFIFTIKFENRDDYNKGKGEG